MQSPGFQRSRNIARAAAVVFYTGYGWYKVGAARLLDIPTTAPTWWSCGFPLSCNASRRADSFTVRIRVGQITVLLTTLTEIRIHDVDEFASGHSWTTCRCAERVRLQQAGCRTRASATTQAFTSHHGRQYAVALHRAAGAFAATSAYNNIDCPAASTFRRGLVAPFLQLRINKAGRH